MHSNVRMANKIYAGQILCNLRFTRIHVIHINKSHAEIWYVAYG